MEGVRGGAGEGVEGVRGGGGEGWRGRGETAQNSGVLGVWA